MALGSGWGAGHCRADLRAWAGPVGCGEEGANLVTHTVPGAFLGLSHLEIDVSLETDTINPTLKYRYF